MFRREPLVRTHTRRPRVARLSAALAALVVVSATLAVSTSGAGAAGSNTLNVKAGEYTYVLKGSPKAGWTQINFDNAGVEDHMMAMFRLKKGTTNAQLKKALLSSDQSAIEKLQASDPNVSGTPGLLGPKQKTSVMTELSAGTYGIACFIPAPDGSPHVAHGMFKTFKVAGKSNLKPPTDGVAEVTLNDGSITVPDGNAPKNLTAKVSNEGTTSHSFDIVKVADGKTLDDVKNYFDTFFNTGKAPEGDPPGTLVGGVDSIAPGGMAYLTWSLPAGNYSYVSTDGQAPDDDYSKGMHGDFTISCPRALCSTSTNPGLGPGSSRHPRNIGGHVGWKRARPRVSPRVVDPFPTGSW
jgi:hypothetical protein